MSSAEQDKSVKKGNLFGEVPFDVAYAGCQHLDCLPGCAPLRGHCERLRLALIKAGYDVDEEEI